MSGKTPWILQIDNWIRLGNLQTRQERSIADAAKTVSHRLAKLFKIKGPGCCKGCKQQEPQLEELSTPMEQRRWALCRILRRLVRQPQVEHRILKRRLGQRLEILRKLPH